VCEAYTLTALGNENGAIVPGAVNKSSSTSGGAVPSVMSYLVSKSCRALVTTEISSEVDRGM